MSENQSKGDRAMLLKCLPFSEPEKIAGLWVVGFEKNDFFEGRRPTGRSIITRASDTKLVAVDDVRSTAPYDALEVELTGRRLLCPTNPVQPHLIVANDLRVKSRRRLRAI